MKRHIPGLSDTAWDSQSEVGRTASLASPEALLFAPALHPRTQASSLVDLTAGLFPWSLPRGWLARATLGSYT